jgi:hypothetical protein
MTGRRKTWLTVAAAAVVAIGMVLSFHRDVIQDRNISALISEGLDGRLLPHRINRLDKLSAVLDDGLRTCEIDVMFVQDSSRGYFEVGHDVGDNIGRELEVFLEAMAPHGVTKLWLDFKNLTDSNLAAALTELDRLDSLYGIRKTAIIESSFQGCGFEAFRHGDFHTGYYMPTDRVTKLLDDGDRPGMLAAAEEIAEQINCQAVSAITFDLRLYPFVKDYLEPLIASTIVYHTWASVKMWKWGALEDLKRRDYYQDARVKSIIYGYQ